MFAVNAKDFTKATRRALAAVRKSSMQIYECLMFDFAGGQLRITGANSEHQVTASCPATGDVDTSFCVSADRIKNIAADSGAVEFRVTEKRVAIKTSAARYQVAILNASDFPLLDCVEGKSFIFPGHLMNRVFHAVAQNDVRYYLNGVHVVGQGQSIRIEASDGHRAARISADVAGVVDSFQSILPREVAKIVAGLGNVGAVFGATQASFSADDTIVITKLTDGKFPELDRVFPSHQNKATFSQESAVSALRAVLGCVDDKNCGVVVNITNGTLRFTYNNASTQDNAEAETNYEGDDGLSMGINGRYLADAFAAQDENIEVRWLDGNSSLCIGGSDLAEVVMPMRV